MIQFHRVPADRLAALASGLGGPASVSELAVAQNSKRLLLLRHLVEAARLGEGRSAEDVLVRADRNDRRVVAELISPPLVGAWTAQTVRRLVGRQASVDSDLRQLGALAAASAIRTGQDARLQAWAIGGGVTLPTLGTALVGADGPVVIDVSDGVASIAGPARTVRVAADDRHWMPLRRLSAQHDDLAVTVNLEDCSPYRNSYHAPPVGRLGPDELQWWRQLFADAWSLLVRLLRRRAAEMSAGLRTLIPLALADGDMARSGTARDMFGALALTRPTSAPDLAITLVHEFQHSKLSGLLELVRLTRPDSAELHFAPWRVDPRPTAGLLQGVYAFLGIADAWHGLRAAPELALQATREFAIARRQVDAGLAALEGSRELTTEGREFVAGLRGAAERLLAEPVPDEDEDASRRALEICRRAWEERSRVSGNPTVAQAVSSPETASRRTAAA
ncbi:HEXXH motif domain-containing protein [Virgisporangium aurantiacum]